MGQVCTRDENVDRQEDDVNQARAPEHKQPEPMRAAAVASDSPNQDEKPKSIAASHIEDMHVDAKIFEPYTKMHQLHSAVQRRLDSMTPLKAESHPSIKAKYSGVPPGTQVVKNTKNSATYQGQMSKGVPHGFGRWITADGGIIEGFFSEGQPDGFIRRITAPHAATFEGEFRHNLANGNGYQIDEKGITTDCKTWVNGQPTGFSTMKTPQGQIIFEGSLDNGKKSGQCTFYDDKQKATFKGTFKNDKLEGKGNKVYDNGQVYDGEFKDGVEHGQGTLTFIDGRKFVGPFSSGRANGAGTLFTDSGKAIKQTWKDGKRA